MIVGALVVALVFLVGSIYFGLRLPMGGGGSFDGGSFFESGTSKVTKMLKTVPSNAGNDQEMFWRRMKPMTVELFQKYWNKAECGQSVSCKPTPLMNFDEAYYSVWDYVGSHSVPIAPCTNYGMRHAKSGREHGIVRSVFPGGDILESTYIDGKQHGLSRLISQKGMYMLDEDEDDNVEIEFYRNDLLEESFLFNEDFEEEERFFEH